MLKNITWTSYLTFMLIGLITYYIIICLKYYKAEIKDILSGRSNMFSKLKSNKAKIFIANNQNMLQHDRSNERNLFSLVNKFTEEINDSLKQASVTNLIKEELLYSLQQLSKKYPDVKGTPFQKFINNFILTEASKYSSIHLSEEDITVLWANNE